MNADVCTLCGRPDAKVDYDRDAASILANAPFVQPGVICDDCFLILCEAPDTANAWFVARGFYQQRDAARDIAVALEQENAELRLQVERLECQVVDQDDVRIDLVLA